MRPTQVPSTVIDPMPDTCALGGMLGLQNRGQNSTALDFA
jgi:hypothetical protein